MSGWHIGIIGGSGLYEVEGVEGGEWVNVASPWGEPSDAIFTGRIGHVRVSFLPRHGRGHRISPSDLNARANVDCLKRLGVTDVLSVSSVGGLQEKRAPGTFTIVDQFIDRTKGRPSSFLAPAWSPMSRWPIRCARDWRGWRRMQPKRRARPSIAEAPVW